MSRKVVQRPQRWDEPFSDKMVGSHIDQILSGPHFRDMDEANFPASLQLRDIVRNDCRVREFEKDQLIVHAGAYINSAFLILSGSAALVLAPGIEPSGWGREKVKNPSLLSALRKWAFKPKFPEVREHVGVIKTKNDRYDQDHPVIIIPDLESAVLETGAETVALQPGDFIGESAVLGRTEMTHTVVSQEKTTVLEIRWQGLRDIGKYQKSFQHFVERLYRERGLVEHLLTVPLFKHVDKKEIHALAKQALFETYGEFEWQNSYRKATNQAKTNDDLDQIIESEPIIVNEGDYPDGLLLIRNGFARVSRLINHGHYTFGHLTAGSLFGLQELYDSWLTDEPQPLHCSLRTLGYTDVIRIPTQWLEHNVFAGNVPDLVKLELEHSLSTHLDENQKITQQPSLIDRKFTEFLVENRLVNGTQTMMIDLERCVRCDDCVTACANAHDNNPRFVRHGPTFGRYMIANACMHCDDPVCMIGCPTGAIHRSKTGVVTINDNTCIGCTICANSCPYDNIRMVRIQDDAGKLFTDEKSIPITKASKCDLCSQVPGGPACERACAHDALVRIDVKDVGRLADWISR